MPHFDYPDIPAEQPKAEVMAQSAPSSNHGVFPSLWERDIRVPVNAEILQGLQVGDEVEVTLRGKVTQLSSDASEGRQRSHLSVLVQSVDAYPADDEIEEAPEDSFTRGFDKGPAQLGRRKY